MHVFRMNMISYHYLILFSQKNYKKEAQLFIKLIQLQLIYFANQFQEIIGLMIENNVIITLRKGLRKFSILLFYLNHLSHIWFDAFVPLIYTLAYNSVLLWKIFKKNFNFLAQQQSNISTSKMSIVKTGLRSPFPGS